MNNKKGILMVNEIAIKGWELLELPDKDGPWITANELSRHLGYTRVDYVSRIYQRHITYFIENIDTMSAGLTINGKPIKDRIFSERGALKILRYSETEISHQIMDEMFEVFLTYKKERPVPREAWSLIAHQGRLITLIAEECGKDRKRIDALEEKVGFLDSDHKRIDDIDKKLSLIEDKKLNSAVSVLKDSEVINVQQAEAIQGLVREGVKGRNGTYRSEMMSLWHAFKKHFGVRKYQDLPRKRFDEAMRWLNQRINGNGASCRD